MGSRGDSRLRRPRNPMPDFVREALVRADLMEAFERRPPYQRNDYLGWIARAKRPATREKRLAQMLDELASGDRYMNMPYNAK
jgi:uncharacterized protein YdeI (YjbR/CyaY-like superfamily)